MIEIKEKQELNITNLLSYRGKVRRFELESVVEDMQEKIKMAGAKQVGSKIAATYAVDGENIDVEIFMPLDKPIASVGRYVYIEQLHIENAVVAIYKGHPAGAQDAIKYLNQYMITNKLQPVTVGYNVTKNVDMLNMENTEIEVYVGIKPNIL